MATQALPDLESQYRALREGAALLDRSERAKIDVLGPDAIEFLQGQVTNDIAALGPGRGCYAVLLSPKGRILSDMRALVRASDGVWLDTDAGSRETLLSKLGMYTVGRQVELADRSAERSIVSLLGPAAAATAGVEPPAAEHSFVEGTLGETALIAVATDLGVDLIFDSGRLGAVLETLTERGAVAVAEEASEIARIESGRPRYGIDMSDDNFPGEVDLESRAVSFEKGCYVGQEPVARMHWRGHPNRHLRGLLLAEAAPAGGSLFSDGKEIGTLTSACVSPALGPIGLGILRREVEPGEQVRVGATGAAARVVALPFGRHPGTDPAPDGNG